MNVAGCRGKSVLLRRTLALLLSVAMIFSLTPMLGGSVAKAENGSRDLMTLAGIEFNRSEVELTYEWMDIYNYEFEFQSGDQLTLNYNENRTFVFSYDTNLNKFVNNEDESDTIELDEISIKGSDYPWSCGGTYNMTMEYQNAQTMISVKVVSNVKSIEYEPVTPVKYIENVEGEYLNEVFIYNDYQRRDGDSLKVVYKDGTEKTYRCNGWDYVSNNDGADVIQGFWVSFYSNQHERPWTVEGNNNIEIVYGDVSCNIPVTIVENSVVGIDFEPANEVSLTEGLDGYNDVIWTDQGEEQFFRYNLPGFSEGDKLTVHYKDKSKKVFTYNREAHVFACGEEVIEADSYPNGISRTDEQTVVHWEKGKNKYYVTYMGKKEEVPVNIVENNVESISFEPAKPYECIEHTNGGYNGDSFFYNIGDSFSKNDRLTVNYSDKSSATYIYTFDELGYDGRFVNENNSNDVIRQDSEYPVQISNSNQYENEWTIANNENNVVIVSYHGKKCEVPVTILENPVASISYTPVTPIVLQENINGYSQTEYVYENDTHIEKPWFRYNYPQFRLGDRLTVNYKDGSTEEYSYNLAKQLFESGEKYIETNNYKGILTEDDQDTIHWEKGKNNRYYVTYMNKKDEVPVEIIDNEVESISFEPAKPYEFIEHTRGYDNGEYYHYNFYSGFSIGDKLKVKYVDRGEITYTYTDNSNYEYRVFVNSDDAEDIINPYGDFPVQFNSNQDESPWTKGGDNKVKVLYHGRSCYVPVNITESPVASIEFTPKTPYEYIEDTHGRYDESKGCFIYNAPRFEYGDLLIVNYNDGTSKTYKRTGGDYFRNIEDKEDVIDSWEEPYNIAVTMDSKSRYESPWTVGNNNKVTVRYLGAECDVPVTIKENPVDRIEYTPIIPITIKENWEGRMETSWFKYDTPRFRIGDKLVVYYKDKSRKEFVFDWVYDAFICGEETIEVGWWYKIDGVSVSDNQEVVHWQKGANNKYQVSYMGKQTDEPVKIVDNNVRSISYTPAKPYEYIENVGGWLGRQGYIYRQPWFGEGDKLTVDYSDKGVITYTNRYSEKNGDRIFIDDNDEMNTISIDSEELSFVDEQSDNPWTVNGNNRIKVSFHGVTCEVPVTVRENTVEGIEFEPAKPYQLKEQDKGFWADDTESFIYSLPDYQESDSLTVYYKDNTNKKYLYDSSKQLFINKNDAADIIDPNGYARDGSTLSRVSNQGYSWETGGNHYWEKGSDNNIVTLTYCGKSDDVPVEIVDSGIESASFTTDCEIYENTCGSEVTDNNGEKYYHYGIYPYDSEILKKGSFVVSYQDGTENTYVYDEDAGGFVNKQNKEDCLYFSELGNRGKGARIINKQKEEHWQVGDTNKLWFEVQGLRFSGNVTIIENPVKDIELSSEVHREVDAASRYDSDGEIMYSISEELYEGDKLTVKYSDDNTKEFIYSAKDAAFVHTESGKTIKQNVVNGFRLFSNQYEEGFSWKVGGENYFYIEYMGKQDSIPVTVLPSDKKTDRIISKIQDMWWDVVYDRIPDEFDDQYQMVQKEYNELSEEQKKHFTKITKDKFDKIGEIVKAGKNVSDVKKLIKDIPNAENITAADIEKIKAAKAAYDLLSDEEKDKINKSLIQKLEKASQKAKELQDAIEAEAAKKAEAEKKAKEEAARKAEAEKKAKEEAAKKAEAEKKAKEEAAKKAETEKKAKEEAAKKAEAERKAKEEAARKAEAEKKAKEEAAKKAEAEKKAREEAAKKAEAERKAAEEKAEVEALAKKDIDKITPNDKVADAAKVDAKLLPQIGAAGITTTGSTKKKTMTIGWKKVKNASNYRIWHRKAGAKKWSTSWSKGKTKFIMKKLKVGGLYEFKISPYTKRDGAWLKGKDSKVSYRYLQVVTGLKATVKVKGKARVSWKMKKGASGYEVLYSLKKNMSKAKKVTAKSVKKTKATISKLKKGKKYYIKVRPYKMYKGKKFIGVMSKLKTVKAK